jgi:hypothetical protein
MPHRPQARIKRGANVVPQRTCVGPQDVATLQQKEVTFTMQHEEMYALISILIIIMVCDWGSTLTGDVSAKSALEIMS